MQLETKKLSNTEMVLFFRPTIAIQGTFYKYKNEPSNFYLLDNIGSAQLAEELLITSDFIYVKSTKDTDLEDLLSLTYAELDDYTSSDPKMKYAMTENTDAKIKIILKTAIAPFLQRDGGDIQFMSYKNGLAKVHFLGKCQGCPYAQRTLKEHVERNLIRYLPEIREVNLA